MDEISIDKIVAAYIKIRDTKDSITSEYKAKVAELAEQMDTLKFKLLDVTKQTGATSFSTPYGTAYRTVKDRYWTSDWDSLYTFMRDNNAFQLLEKRIHQTNMKEFLENNPGEEPMGLNIDREYDITIRRK